MRPAPSAPSCLTWRSTGSSRWVCGPGRPRCSSSVSSTSSRSQACASPGTWGARSTTWVAAPEGAACVRCGERRETAVACPSRVERERRRRARLRPLPRARRDTEPRQAGVQVGGVILDDLTLLVVAEAGARAVDQRHHDGAKQKDLAPLFDRKIVVVASERSARGVERRRLSPPDVMKTGTGARRPTEHRLHAGQGRLALVLGGLVPLRQSLLAE